MRPSLAKDGIFGGNGQVADNVQDVAAADGVAVYEGDDGLGQRADLLLHVQNVQPRDAVLAHIAAAILHVHVTAAAEGLVSRAGKKDHVDIRAFAAVGECLAHLLCCIGREGVAVAGPVDSDPGYAFIIVKEYLFVFFDGFPFALCHSPSGMAFGFEKKIICPTFLLRLPSGHASRRRLFRYP